MAWDTAGNIINDAATELGLQAFQAKSADPFASTDANIGQLCQLLKSVGRDLAKKREWTHLRAEYTLTTAANVGWYDLPGDFGRMINQTGWNRTNRLPLGGPLSPQEWQYLKGQLAGIVFTVLFRPMQGKIWLYPDTNTPAGYVLAFEYVSRWWVESAVSAALPVWMPKQGDGDTTVYAIGDKVRNGSSIYSCTANASGGFTGAAPGPTGTATSGILDGDYEWGYDSASGKGAPDASDDVVLFEPQLAMRALKLAFLRAKGFDTTAAEDDYEDAYAQACIEDTPARVLRLGGESVLRQPLIGGQNIPITNFGS